MSVIHTSGVSQQSIFDWTTVGNRRRVDTMKIFYRGYVIDEEIRSISYSVYGQRPQRLELTARSTSREAMEWIDSNVKRDAILGATRTARPITQQAVYQVA
jgi:hypothetical protein